MSRLNIVVILLVAVLLGALFSVFTQNSESVVFARAFAEPGVEFKVSGTLDNEHPVVYDPEVSAAETRFHMRDKDGQVTEVFLNEAKPTGLEQSESIDLYGKVEDGRFIATDMLMKCPSKYNEDSHSLAEASPQAN
ncbi:cytochrome c maturation protein CcmE [Flavobacteriales bacterium]|jgi:cytochrome c-type biogenesis protein CcmE|nr:cytochrome c maturation protein CcmE [Flavobacteriales bacterium]MDA9863965.1 cytochrome c maturation protein CcmE [Flavobacteriales bacterium]